MKPRSIIKCTLLFFIVVTSLYFTPDFDASLNIEAAGFTNSQSLIAATDISSNSEGERERPLFESILLYLIIFTPVIVVTLLLWVFSKIIKLTKEKNEG
ncbi:hypothetical protein FZC79_11730 [Rossellomorea vietnamensis]|uniref:Uncharacterized protein n=2 Tax=Rossellomorea TaxID=2837508 RepID=A0A5D4KD14_9BACI|nr:MULTISPECIES: hypothetical protein [Rossellomorea]TYR75082.1 hypothetical protein FZC79_11730 [Rossellomorea vietnamensis]TYS79838.1 hypothetical protein FZC80_09380 [Rossellomorea aquimaris]